MAGSLKIVLKDKFPFASKISNCASFKTPSLVQGTRSMKTKPEVKMREGEEEDTYSDESMTWH